MLKNDSSQARICFYCFTFHLLGLIHLYYQTVLRFD